MSGHRSVYVWELYGAKRGATGEDSSARSLPAANFHQSLGHCPLTDNLRMRALSRLGGKRLLDARNESVAMSLPLEIRYATFHFLAVRASAFRHPIGITGGIAPKGQVAQKSVDDKYVGETCSI